LAINSLEQKPPLEAFALKENKHLYWWASWYADILGYKSLSTFKETIQKAKNTCIALGINLDKNIIGVRRKEEGRRWKDYKLSKFFCFLLSIHADSRKPVVKRARLYFLNELEELHLHLDADDYFERKALRESIRESASDLNREAKQSNVKDLSVFINEGYHGLYNKSMVELKKERGLKGRDDLYDHMTMTELSANLFRIALTEERLKNLSHISGDRAGREHWRIGSKIRGLIRESSGRFPESLLLEKSLSKIEKSLRKAQLMLNAEIKEGIKEIEKETPS
jgi:DNA-damage-inducible protein D